jgi:hypothetical protein
VISLPAIGRYRAAAYRWCGLFTCSTWTPARFKAPGARVTHSKSTMAVAPCYPCTAACTPEAVYSISAVICPAAVTSSGGGGGRQGLKDRYRSSPQLLSSETIITTGVRILTALLNELLELPASVQTLPSSQRNGCGVRQFPPHVRSLRPCICTHPPPALIALVAPVCTSWQ